MNAQYDRETLDRRLTAVVPTERQIAWQQMEFYSFVHFTVNTFTGREWGDGTEPEEIFNPTAFDASQWVDALKAAGMKGLILTCKHHDGFCLWPSRYTGHSVANSPFRGGKGDVVREVSEACRRGGLRFGIYLSPWDRNCALYGQGKAYDDYFVNQLTELLTGYGEICSVWFDGACGEGPNGKKQVYDWERYYAVIRRLQPDACIHVCGPDVRWCGNEAGDTRPSEWSVVPKRASETERIASKSQQADETQFRERKISAGDQDLGSRDVLADEAELIWYPAEVNTSIRPGWFYHEEEDELVRPLEELLHIYYHSAGGNAGFLLNIPPTKEGLFHANDVKRLCEIGEYLKKTFARNLAKEAELSADAWEEGHEIDAVRTDDYDSFFRTQDGVRTAQITLAFPEPARVSHVVLKENIRMSQRIEGFEITAVSENGEEQEVYRGTVVGYQKIARFPEIAAKRLQIRITDSRVFPTLSFIGVY
ncbi:MAG TPA: alpha-L-fucosidase [Candidatus Eisenbergiella merdavium]|uniref:alpha-L-fucosidase n=1 Tax=Candidatus Eisenbergiella merdavium TaxID=2838551 RepID=A0A9D2SRT3_9FIRM|nr:alpha-L-fucosidase [Candidatus Eisenbergiella merdavium]